jgi:hypothetical protein
MDVFLDFVFLVHLLLFNRVMDQFKFASMGDLPQLRVALTVDNVNDGDENGLVGGGGGGASEAKEANKSRPLCFLELVLRYRMF